MLTWKTNNVAETNVIMSIFYHEESAFEANKSFAEAKLEHLRGLKYKLKLFMCQLISLTVQWSYK